MPDRPSNLAPIEVTSADLAAMEFDELRFLADQVGVGYAGIEHKELLERLLVEGQPVLS